MLETLRSYSKGWVAALLILLLIGSFGFWGVQDWINVSTATKIATVGGEDIAPERFQREFASYLRRLARETKSEISTTEAKALNLDRTALDEFLNRIALSKKGEKLGLAATNSQVVDVLKANIPDGAGGVNRTALQQILSESQLSEAEFYDLVRLDLLRSQLLRTITGGVTLPPGIEAALHRFRLQRLVAEYVLIDPSRAGEIKDPDEATLKKYYDSNADQKYATPEYRALTALTLSAKDVESRVTITEDELKKTYERARSYFETPEKRRIEQIRFKTETRAREAKTKLDAGETFEAIAKVEGYKPEDIKLGEVSKTDTTIPPAAFELPVNKISDPLKGPFGWVILRVLSVTPGTTKPFEEARAEIRQQFLTERTKDILVNLAIEIEDALGGGATLEEAAKKQNLQPTKIAAVDARGSDPAGAPVQGLPGGDFLAQVFASESGVDSDFAETPDGVRYIFRVDKVTPAARKPLAQVRADVLAHWREDELTKRLTAIADDLTKKGNAGTSMASLASSLGVTPLRTDPMPRYGKQAVLGPDALTAIGDAKVGQFVTGSVADGKSRIVARLAEVVYAEDGPNAELRAQYGAQLRQIFGEDLVEQFTNAVRAEVGVKVDEAEFTKFHTGE